MRTNGELRKILKENGLVFSNKYMLSDLRYVMGRDDWYAQVKAGDWYWYDQLERKWKRLPNGPIDSM
jgi:hypothetical protein